MAIAQTDNMVMPISLGMIEVDRKFNARHIGNKEEYDKEVKKLAASIKENGQDTPVMVKRLESGRFFLLAGFRRYDAISLLGGEDIQAKIKTGDSDDVADILTNLRENVERKNISTFDLADRCYVLKQDHKMEPKDIARALNAGMDEDRHIGVPYVNMLIRHREGLIKKIVDGWRDGDVTFNALVQGQVVPLTDAEQADWWEEYRGGKEASAEDGEDGEKKAKKTKKRAKPGDLAKALAALSESKAPAKYLEGVGAALQFALGQRRDIPDVYEIPKKAKKTKAKGKKGKGGKGEEASAEA